ncbi:MAG: PHP domain-containing protein [Kiritimatiellae bacterium]|nr:PHP domain-containing protein [Kiritimatiellia bacterium]
MKFDLHIHSCLSPCANLEMSPSEIVRRAVAAGMDGIALTDHQTAKNTPAIAECARRAGLKCLCGLEVQTAEEVHTVALFDTVEQSLAMTDWVYEAMPKRVNDPETFGDQPVVTWDDDVVEMEWRILAMGCRRLLPETSAKVHELGGLYVAAHVDRANHSVFGALGCIPEPLPGERAGRYFDAVELSRTADEARWLPKIGDYAVVRSSDAHNLDDVARVWTEAEGEFSVAGFKKIFAARSTRISPRLTSF